MLIKKEVKSYNAGKTKTIKKQTIKILPPTKKVEKVIVKTVKQTGSSNTKYDKLRQALPAGKRKSATGKTYYEYRRDHSDAGVLLGFKNDKTIDKIKVDLLNDFEITCFKIDSFTWNLNDLVKNKKQEFLTLSPQAKKIYISTIINMKKYIAELKKHKTELKKLL